MRQVVDLTIRSATVGDLMNVCTLYRHLNPKDDPSPEERDLAAVWTTMLAQPGYTCLVGIRRDLLVSSCCLAIIPNLTHGARPYALIENVVTHQDFRRKGFAGALLDEALSRAWLAGCYKVMLLTGSKRPETHRFYESRGFRSDEKTAFVARPSR